MKIPEDQKSLAALFKKLGAEDPDSWASSQINEGINQLGRFLFLREAWKQVIDDDPSWIERKLSLPPDREGAPLSEFKPALKRIMDAGADPKDVTAIVRIMQYNTFFGICYLMDDPGFVEEEIQDLFFRLFLEDEEGYVVRDIPGLHESVLSMDPTGREMRPASYFDRQKPVRSDTNKMEVFKMEFESEHFFPFRLENKEDGERFKGAIGKPMTDNWEPIRLLAIESKNKELGEVGCFRAAFNSILTFSDRAVDALENDLKAGGELLPIKSDRGEYFMFNPIHEIKALDEENSDLSRFDDGSIMSVNEFQLLPEILVGQSVFQIAGLRKQLFATGEFVNKAADAGLTGFRFTKIWSTERS